MTLVLEHVGLDYAYLDDYLFQLFDAILIDDQKFLFHILWVQNCSFNYVVIFAP